MAICEKEWENIHLENYIYRMNDFSILSNTADSFLILKKNGQLAFISEACQRFLDYSSGEIKDMVINDIFPASSLNEQNHYFKEQNRDTLSHFDTHIKTKSGDYIHVHLTAFPIVLHKATIGSYAVIKKMTHHNDQVFMSEKQAVAGQLAAGIAHEIRNPMTAIKGFLQLMMKDYKGKKASYFEIIKSEIERIELILRELMVLAKPNKVSYKKVKLDSLLEQILTLMRSQALLNDIEIEDTYCFKDASIYGDENQLKQVFINYIKNAIEAMPDGGKITIEGEFLSENQVIIRIVDEGPGIPSEILERISEPFFTTKEQGTGLGMPVSYQIIKEHKGDMLVSSSSSGTCIEVVLPRES
ncbi:ATP-binding protein [Cytobacillus gottheilii]|uniref:ATP-binding protein n=1 Tax=Cytobacillus gottheilii TaxID=859144 RepID=UPI0009B98188|nr:ATP-binding protein [Cytobacillus gottheilii]